MCKEHIGTMMFKTFHNLLLVGVLCLAQSQESGDSTDSIDADGICGLMFPTNEDLVTGSVVGCQLICKVTNRKNGQTTTKPPAKVPNYVSCGTNMTCFYGACKTTDTEATRACQLLAPNSYGVKKRGPSCEATCYNAIPDDPDRAFPHVPYLPHMGTPCVLHGKWVDERVDAIWLEMKEYSSPPMIGICLGLCQVTYTIPDATTTCKALLEEYLSDGKQVSGVVQGCRLKCSVTSTNDKGVKSTASTSLRMPDTTSCGKNSICYDGNCVNNNTKATETCGKSILKSYGYKPEYYIGHYGVLEPPCKVKCHAFMEPNQDQISDINMPNGTVCLIQGNVLGKCRSGLCK